MSMLLQSHHSSTIQCKQFVARIELASLELSVHAVLLVNIAKMHGWISKFFVKIILSCMLQFKANFLLYGKPFLFVFGLLCIAGVVGCRTSSVRCSVVRCYIFSRAFMRNDSRRPYKHNAILFMNCCFSRLFLSVLQSFVLALPRVDCVRAVWRVLSNLWRWSTGENKNLPQQSSHWWRMPWIGSWV